MGGKCSNPNCRRETKGPHSNPQKRVSIGEAAHITAAAEGGPRYNPDLTPEERSSIENGIWLCKSCARMIDSDEISIRQNCYIHGKVWPSMNNFVLLIKWITG